MTSRSTPDIGRHPIEVRGVLLDMDGTLVDSDAAVDRVWSAWAVAHGVDPAAVVAACRGETSEATIRRFRPDLDDATVAREADEHMRSETADLDGVVAADGAYAFLTALAHAGLPWAVVTNADRGLALARLGAAGIRPPVLVTVDDVAVGKPDPAIYRLGAARLGVATADCLVVEDSAAGVAAGTAAGAGVVGLREVAAPIRVDGLASLVGCVRRAPSTAAVTPDRRGR